jgi:hypothetical protein
MELGQLGPGHGGFRRQEGENGCAVEGQLDRLAQSHIRMLFIRI